MIAAAAAAAATLMAWIHEETVACLSPVQLLELNLFNSSNRGGDRRSPVGRRLPVVNTRGDGRHLVAATIASCIHYITLSMTAGSWNVAQRQPVTVSLCLSKQETVNRVCDSVCCGHCRCDARAAAAAAAAADADDEQSESFVAVCNLLHGGARRWVMRDEGRLLLQARTDHRSRFTASATPGETMCCSVPIHRLWYTGTYTESWVLDGFDTFLAIE